MYIDLKRKTTECNQDVPFLKTNYAFTVTMLITFVVIIALQLGMGGLRMYRGRMP
jgi:hypothetical protein